MALLLIAPDRDPSALCARIMTLEPGLDLRVWPDLGDSTEIEFALAWNPPDDVFRPLTGLKAVCSLGAGVDALLPRSDIPKDVAITRIAGPRLAADLAAYVVAMTVDWWKRLDEQRHSDTWTPLDPRPVPRVGLLGTGRMGQAVARAFQALDLPVAGWNRSGRPFPPTTVGTEVIERLEIRRGSSGLQEVARESDVLVNLLPLTDETRGLLDRSLFESMRDDSLLIQVGRGAHLVERDLLAALDRGRPGRAVLDVFSAEPLPDSSPLRTHPGVVITPHIAGRTDPAEAAAFVVEQWRCIQQGRHLPEVVDRSRGY